MRTIILLSAVAALSACVPKKAPATAAVFAFGADRDATATRVSGRAASSFSTAAAPGSTRTSVPSVGVQSSAAPRGARSV